MSDLCKRATCCDEKTPQTDGPACWDIGACGCKVVAHPPHPTTYFSGATPMDNIIPIHATATDLRRVAEQAERADRALFDHTKRLSLATLILGGASIVQAAAIVALAVTR